MAKNHPISPLFKNLTIQDDVVGSNFDENTKAIALLFGQKSPNFTTFQEYLTIQDDVVGSNFDENTKAIALGLTEYFLANFDENKGYHPISPLFKNI